MDFLRSGECFKTQTGLLKHQIHVGTRLIPSDQPMHGKRMAEVVEPRLKAASVFAMNLCDSAQSAKRLVRKLYADRLTVVINEERRVIGVRMAQAASSGRVTLKSEGKVLTDWYQSILI